MKQARSVARCDECGGPNPAWLTDFDTWSRYVPEDDGQSGEGFTYTVLCPYCFAARVGRATGRELGAHAAVSATVATLRDILSDVEQRQRRRSLDRARMQACRAVTGTSEPPDARLP